MFRPGVFLALMLVFSNSLSFATENAQSSSAALENPGYEDKPTWFKSSFLDLREDVQEATENNKRIMLYFYQDGCPYCARLIKDNFSDPKIAAYTQTHFEVIAINMWGNRMVNALSNLDIAQLNI